MNKYRYIVPLEYFQTFAIAFISVCAVVFFLVLYMINDIYELSSSEKPKFNEEEVFQGYLVDVMIDKNLYLAKNYPKSYVINLRLGMLYAYKKDYKTAEKELLKAIAKAPNGKYSPVYRLALLYIKMDRLQDAQDLIDNIGEKPQKRLIQYKGEIYAKIGDKYAEKDYLALAAQKYEKSLMYFKKNNSKDLSQTKKKLLETYLELADKYVDDIKIEEAIDSLEKAYEVEHNPIVTYKLGILLVDNDPTRAYDLLSTVYKYYPQKMDFDVYYNLLNSLGDAEFKRGNEVDAKLYYSKAQQYKKFTENNILYQKDLFVDIMKSEITNNRDKNEYLMSLQLRIQNNSGHDIDNLTIDVIFTDGDIVIKEFTEKIFDKGRIFNAGALTPPIVINAVEPYKKSKKDKHDNKDNQDISVDIYAHKQPKYSVQIATHSFMKPEMK